MGKTTTNNIPENAADIISPNFQESMRSNNQRAAICTFNMIIIYICKLIYEN